MNKIYLIDDIFRSQSYGSYPDVQSLYGFFYTLWTLDVVDETYTDDNGNPLQTWTNEENIIVPQLDFNYLSRSAEKICRPFIWKQIITGDPGDVPEGEYFSNEKNVVEYITRKYSKKWMDMWQTMFYEYNPIENYNMLEELTDQVTEFEHGHVETYENGKVNTRSGSVKETPGVTITETKSMKGFDSDAFVGTDQDVSAPSGFNQTEYTNLKDTASGTDTHRNSGTDKETKNYMLTRSGNIGVTTSQQMIEQERKILMFNYFDQIVFPDIDKELTIKVY